LPALRALIKARDCQPIVPLGLNLKPVHQERYEEVRRWRRELRWGDSCTVVPGVAVQLPPQQKHK